MQMIQERLQLNHHLISRLELDHIFFCFLLVCLDYFPTFINVAVFLWSLCTTIASIPSPPGQVPVVCALRGEGVN